MQQIENPMILTTTNCEVNDLLRFQIERTLAQQISELPSHAAMNMNISKNNDLDWTFDLSLRYNRGHVALKKTARSLSEVIDQGLTEFTRNLQMHKFQLAIETFHFDKTAEYDYYTEVSTESYAQPKRPLSILIVEDDPAAALVLQSTLKSLGCEVDHCDLPEYALAALQNHRYDLLILDWNLPYMKGGDFLKEADQQLKKADRPGLPVRQVPVVICTSLPLQEITLPPVSHFSFYNHWHKGLPFSSIFGAVDETTKQVLARNLKAA